MKQFFVDGVKAVVLLGVTIPVLLGIMILVGCPEAEQMVGPVVDEMMEPVDTEPPTVVDESVEQEEIVEEPVTEEVSVEQQKPEIKESENLPVQMPGDEDLVGKVYVPKSDMGKRARQDAQPISGVSVTIMTGPRSGESIVTDQNGQYFFSDVEEDDELHLRVEKEGFESKEVIVSRSKSTILASGVATDYWKDPQRHPGNILIGMTWPEEVQFILEQTLLVPDLLYVKQSLGPYGGLYNSGVVMTNSDHKTDLGIIAHEIAHAHQHALTYPDGTKSWVKTPEGKAFTEARRKDWEEHGKSRYDTAPGLSSDEENAAETCAYHWWNIGQWKQEGKFYRDMEEKAPNRLRWAQEWLTKK